MKLQVSAKPARRGSFTQLAPGLAVLTAFRAHFDPDGGDAPPYVVDLDVAMRNGRYVCTRMSCEQVEGGPVVDGEGLRRLPVARMIRLAVEHTIVGVGVEAASAGSTRLTPLSWPIPDRAAGPTDEALRSVAISYRVAYACGLPPTQQVKEDLNLPRSTAGRWVTMARERGFLGPAEVGKAGEAT